MHFLVVDDSSAMRRIITNTLNRLGHNDIVEAANGREGLDRLAEGTSDLIITDWIMPEMDGIQFVLFFTAWLMLEKQPGATPTSRVSYVDVAQQARLNFEKSISTGSR